MLFRIWQATYFASRTLFSLRLPSPSISTTDAGLGRDDSRAGGPQLKIAPFPVGACSPRGSTLAPGAVVSLRHVERPSRTSCLGLG